MKLIGKTLDRKNAGTVTLIAEESEDMWHAYNLINVGDYLRSSTIRRVVNESTTTTTTSRVHTTLTILVKSVDYDMHASVLHVKGTNFEENQYVKMGAYHTIDLELNRKFTITKSEWDSVAMARIEEACDPSHSADLAAVVMQEGLAHVCLIQSSMTTVKAKIEMNIPRKRKGLCTNHDKNMEKFFERIIQSILTHINFDVVKAIIIASPGFIKDQFMEYMNQYATKYIQTCKPLIDNRSKFILAHSASGFKHSLKEIFEDPSLAPRLSDTKALGEVKALDAFFSMLKTEPTRAYYGLKHLQRAAESDAVDTLLITDALFRSKELSERKKYVAIVDRVKENNGQVRIFSSLHVSGEQLMQFTGIAAILRFPMPELEDEALTESDDDDERENEANENNNNSDERKDEEFYYDDLKSNGSSSLVDSAHSSAKQLKLNSNNDEHLKVSASTSNVRKPSLQQLQVPHKSSTLTVASANSSSSPAIAIAAQAAAQAANSQSGARKQSSNATNIAKKGSKAKFIAVDDDDDDFNNNYRSTSRKYDYYDDDDYDF